MKAIKVKFLGPTNTKGDRLKAIADGNSITINYNYELYSEENYQEAANVLASKLEWTKDFDVVECGWLNNEKYFGLKSKH